MAWGAEQGFRHLLLLAGAEGIRIVFRLSGDEAVSQPSHRVMMTGCPLSPLSPG